MPLTLVALIYCPVLNSHFQCAKLVYLFWLMSRVNIFGPLFTEVDTNGALKILAYIKPQIVGRVHDRISDASEAR